jgi:16S rRNA (guanine966-N2)-methyltransferase
MRIIAGRFRGRRLYAPSGRAVRPTGDKLKGSMFSALGDACQGAGVLDLFSGSGALGLEALSRGASQAVFVERSRESLSALESNIAALDARDLCRVVRTGVEAFLERESAECFDLVFADPPYGQGLDRLVLEWWLDGMRPGAVLVLEHAASETPQRPDDSLAPLKVRIFGSAAYSVYVRQEERMAQ